MLLAGCTAPAKKTEALELTGALVVVRLQSRQESPPAIAIEIVSGANGSSSTVTGRRQQSIPGRYADYLVALALQPQRYSITAIRTTGKTLEEPSELLASMMISFDVKPSNPAYLGRLVIATELATNVVNINVQDHFDEDILLFRTALAALRTAIIDKNIVESPVFAPIKVGARLENMPHPVSLAVDALSGEAQSLLPVKARPAFRRFLALSLPRALAVDNAGGSSLRSGEGAVALAMRGCTKRAGDKSCRIFAVDNTVVLHAPCLSVTEGQAPSTISTSACLVKPQKVP